MMTIKQFIKRVLKLDSYSLLKELKENGAQIGNVIVSGDIIIDRLWPFMLSIGDDVHITNKVTILCHDFSWSVIKKFDGTLMGGGKAL